MDKITINFQNLRNQEESIKSKTVVQYSSVPGPINFDYLKLFTNIKLKPSCWLSNEFESYGLRHIMYTHSDSFTSFQLAHGNLDQIGIVDFVSDAKTIKHLLKIEYSKESASMMVHKIGNTFLLDEFDVQTNLKSGRFKEWIWLRNYYTDYIKSFDIKEECLTNKSSNLQTLNQNTLQSKFLYHSIANSLNSNTDNQERNQYISKQSLTMPPLLEPTIHDKFPDNPDTHRPFNQNVLWDFEGIKMLIGSDIPIFRDYTGTHVNLTLRDMLKRLDPCTTIDYWLDNLMCDIPKLVMCNHLNGSVQTYDFIQTNNLPNFKNTEFSPAAIGKLVNKTSLFLRKNATKSGHTYWLLKGKKDLPLKLFDLTELSSESNEGNYERKNPFAVSVAMLLYCVACNLKYKREVQRKSVSSVTIYTILKNCVELLDKTKYPQFVASVHYMLSDLFIPIYTNPTSPTLNDLSNVGEYSLLFDVDLTKFNKITLEERCRESFNNFELGVKSLQHFNNLNSQLSEANMQVKKDESKMAVSSQTVPMINTFPESDPKNQKCENIIYVDLTPKRSKRNKCMIVEDRNDYGSKNCLKSILGKSAAENLPTWVKPSDVCDSVLLKQHLRILLYEKVCLLFAVLSEHEMTTSNFARAFHHFRSLFICQLYIANTENLLGYILRHCGDCCMIIAHKWKIGQTYSMEDNTDNYYDLIVNEILKDLRLTQENETDLDIIPNFIKSKQDAYIAACNCYGRSLELQKTITNIFYLSRRIGHIYNLLSSDHQLELWTASQNRIQISETRFNCLLNEFDTYIQKAIEIYKNINDPSSVALTYSNKALWYRHISYYLKKKSPCPFSVPDKFMLMAEEYYKTALMMLGNRYCDPNRWDTIHWNISSTTYDMALQYQDSCLNDVQNKAEIDKTSISLLLNALNNCHIEVDKNRKLSYSIREGNIHVRLAGVYDLRLRRTNADSKFKTILQLCISHYDNAFQIFFQINCLWECLNVLTLKINIEEFQLSRANGFQPKFKFLMAIESIFKKCETILQTITKSNSGECKLQDIKYDGHNLEKLEMAFNSDLVNTNKKTKILKTLEESLQHFLKHMIKMASEKTSTKLIDKVDLLKIIYGDLLRKNINADNCLCLLNTLTKILELQL